MSNINNDEPDTVEKIDTFAAIMMQQREPGRVENIVPLDNIPESLRKKYPPSILRDAATLYEERNKVYGSNYQRFGRALLALFPDNTIPAIGKPEDADRLQILVQLLTKMTRYAENLTKGGHLDSADDLVVYAAMLREFTK